MDKKNPNDAIQDAMLHAMAEKEKTDTLIRAKIISREIYHRLFNGMKNEKGVHIESLLTALAALGGFSCQMAVREGLIKTGKISPQHLLEVKCKNGEVYYFGDELNNTVFGPGYSLYGVAGGGMAQAGGKKHPDTNEIAGYVAGTLGGEKFGIPRFPEGHGYGDLPINSVKALWPVFLPLLVHNKVDPLHWPIAFGLAIQQAIIDGKAALNPELAFQMVMEVAIPMSKIDPKLIYGSIH